PGQPRTASAGGFRPALKRRQTSSRAPIVRIRTLTNSFRPADIRGRLRCYSNCVNGDLDVGTLVDRYGPMVLRRCRQPLLNQHEALDACQDVFVRVIERRTRLDVRYPSSLLYTIATNVCLNRIRDRARREEPSDEERLAQIARADGPDGTS